MNEDVMCKIPLDVPISLLRRSLSLEEDLRLRPKRSGKR